MKEKRSGLKKILLALLVVAAAALAAVVSYDVASIRESGRERILSFEIEGQRTSYSELELLEHGGQLQFVNLGEDDAVDPASFGVRSYPNQNRLSAREWLHLDWDVHELLILEDLNLDFGDSVVVRDANAWADMESAAEFPVVAVISVGDQIYVIDRPNGVSITPEQIVDFIADVGLP